MDKKILYCYKIVSKNITRNEISNYRIVDLVNAKKEVKKCIIYFKNTTRNKCIIDMIFLDIVFHGVIYSFDPSFEKAARIFIEFYEKKKRVGLRDVKFCEKTISWIFDEYLK